MKKTKTPKQKNNPEIAELKNQLTRALADYDNLQKRINRERETIKELISAQILTQLLPVFDMFEHVQKSLKDSGLAIALKELDEKLKEQGFIKIEPKVGDRFNQQEHEATEAVVSKNKKPGEIIEVFSPGFKLENGFIVRPAKVKVSK